MWMNELCSACHHSNTGSKFVFSRLVEASFGPPWISFPSSLDSCACLCIHFLFFYLLLSHTLTNIWLSRSPSFCLPLRYAAVTVRFTRRALCGFICAFNKSLSLLVSVSYPVPWKDKYWLSPLQNASKVIWAFPQTPTPLVEIQSLISSSFDSAAITMNFLSYEDVAVWSQTAIIMLLGCVREFE